MNTQRIVIVGAGFAGMWSALAAARVLDMQKCSDIEIVLVAPQPELHVRPRLYEEAPNTMRVKLTELLDAVGVKFMQGSVEKIDAQQQQVVVKAHGPNTQISYDRLVLAAGSTLFRPDIPGLTEHAFNVDQVEDAVTLEAHIQGLHAQPDTEARRTLVVVGGGLTGIETAAEMPARLRAVLGESADVNVVIVERNNDIGPDLGPGPRPIIEQALAELGVTVVLGAGVTAIDNMGWSHQRASASMRARSCGRQVLARMHSHLKSRESGTHTADCTSTRICA